jgi:Zn-dependent protease
MLTLVLAAATFFALTFLYLANGDVLLRFAVAVAVLMLSGRMIAATNGIKESYGAYLLGGKRGIKLVESLSRKHPRLWIAFADWGLVLGFGLISYLLFGKYVSKKMMLLGIASLLVIFVLVFPYLSIVISFINIPQITSSVSSIPATQSVSPFFYIFVALGIIGGFSLFTIFLIFYSGGSILYSTFTFLLGLFASKPNYAILTQQVPGVAPLLPGITIPFFAGIIALFILLVVHEFSHGVLAKIAKVRIKSIGAILFGVIPMGAFVEPDERQVKKLKESLQNRISIAGVSANMLTSLVFFVFALVLIYYVLPNIGTGGVLVTQTIKNYPAYGVIAPNSVILMWNSVRISNEFALQSVESSYKPGEPVQIATNKGTFSLTPTSDGKLGVTVVPAQITGAYQSANFLYAIAALSFGLNFFVAIFNLLPIPGFDGWRVYQSKVKSKRAMKWIAIALVFALLLNVLPWFWTIG